MKLEISRHIFEKYAQIKMKICLVGVELCYADGQTHMTKLMGAFRIFGKVPKKAKPPAQLTTVVATYQQEGCGFLHQHC